MANLKGSLMVPWWLFDEIKKPNWCKPLDMNIISTWRSVNQLEDQETSGERFWSSKQHIYMKQARSSQLKRSANNIEQLAKFCVSRYLLQVDVVSKFDAKF